MSTLSDSLQFTAAAHPQIRAVPAFDDNYLWLIVDPDTRRAAIVDPGDADAVERALAADDLSLSAILLTHHHADHIGGVEALVSHWHCPVFGPADTRIPAISRTVRDCDLVQVPGLAVELTVIAVPGHTRSHIAYHAEHIGPDTRGVLFSGDTLFAGGCGRLFEGTPGQMFDSLGRLATLDPATLVYCAHEYTLANLAFALAAEPDAPALRARLQEARALRELGQSTVPSTIAVELRTNPFLRTDAPELVQTMAAHGASPDADPSTRFAALRQWKDNFRS